MRGTILSTLIQIKWRKYTHSCNQIRAFCCGLWRHQIIGNLLPLGVASHCDKKVWFAVFANGCHRVLVALGHVPLATNERGRQNEPFSNVCASQICIIGIHGVDNSLLCEKQS